MIEIHVDTLHEFMRALLPTEPHFSPLGGASWLYRGQEDSRWGLVPTSRRSATWKSFGGVATFHLSELNGVVTSSDEHLAQAEDSLLSTLSQVVNRLGLAPQLAHDPARMAFARHIGLPTRLLDWTRSPWTAAYFAASGALARSQEDGRLAVFVMSTMYYKGW